MLLPAKKTLALYSFSASGIRRAAFSRMMEKIRSTETFLSFLRTCRVQNAGHTTSGSRRGARRSGGAGSGRTVRQQNCYLKKILPRTLQSIEDTSRERLSRSTNKRKSLILCTYMQTDGGTKPAVDNRYIRGLTAVHHRDEKRPFFLAADQWTDAFLSR